MELNAARDAIEKCQYLRGLDKTRSGFLLMKARSRELSAGEMLYSKGEESGGRFALIVSGRVGVVAGSGQVLRELGAGEVIGEIGSISPQQRRTFTVNAVEPTAALEWELKEVEEGLPEIVKILKDLAWRRVSDWLE
jgi:CRP-like cAMP-binding protein